MTLSARARWLLLLPALLALVIYLPAVNFDFIWDDRDLLVRSAGLRNWSDLWDTSNRGFLSFRGYYRPLPLLTLGLEQIFQSGSFLPHLDAVLLHTLNTSLLGLLAREVAAQTGSDERQALRIGLLAGFIYACHPALIESVAWISSRFDLLLATFSLCMLLADRAARRTGPRAALVAGFFLLAALCKEMAVALALLLPIWHLMFEPAASWPETLASFRRRGHFAVYGAMFMAGLLYLYLRSAGLGSVFITPHSVVDKYSSIHLVFVLKTLGTDVLLMLFPFTSISPLHSFAGVDPIDADTWIGGGVVLVCLALGAAAVRGARNPALLLLCCGIALLPVSNIIPLQLRDCYTAERFLALPIIFMVLWWAVALVRAIPAIEFPAALKRLVAAMLAVFWFGFCLLNLFVTVPLWHHDVYLWTWAYDRVPQSETAQVNLEAAYIDNRLYDKAREFCQRSIKQHEAAGTLTDIEQYGHYLTALVYSDAPSAEVKPLFALLEKFALQHANGSDGERTLVYNNLGWLYLLRGHAPQSLRHLQAALVDQPKAPATNFGLAVAQFALGNKTAGEAYLRTAREYATGDQAITWTAQLEDLVKKAGAAGAYPGDLP